MPDVIDDVSENNDFRKMGRALSDEFNQTEGRRPRILVSAFLKDTTFSPNKLCNILADMGYDVDIAPKLSSLSVLATQSIENDTDVILIYSDRNDLDHELQKLQHQVLSKQPDIMMSLFLADSNYITALKSKFTRWVINDQTISDSMMAYRLLTLLMTKS